MNNFHPLEVVGRVSARPQNTSQTLWNTGVDISNITCKRQSSPLWTLHWWRLFPMNMINLSFLTVTGNHKKMIFTIDISSEIWRRWQQQFRNGWDRNYFENPFPWYHSVGVLATDTILSLFPCQLSRCQKWWFDKTASYHTGNPLWAGAKWSEIV